VRSNSSSQLSITKIPYFAQLCYYHGIISLFIVMKFLYFLRNAVPAMALMLFMLPVVNAGPIGDAFDATVSQNSFSYDAHASIMLSPGGELDVPFTAELSVREEGGKNQGTYGKSGAIWAELRDLQDLPRELQGLSKMNLMLNYNGAHVESSKTSYAEVESLAFSSDHEKMNEIMGMMNQFAKFFTGKSFKVSQLAIAEKVRSLIGDSYYGPSEEELFLSALTGGNQSIPEVIAAVGDFVDAMIDSGFLDMKLIQGSQRRGRVIVADVYVLTFGDEVTPQGAEVFRDSFAKFFSMLFPGVGDMLADEITRESGESIARDLTSFLQEASAVKMELTVTISNGVIQSTDFLMDFSALGLPVKIEETVAFNYNSAYNANIPRDENSIIDMNQIVDGFVAIAEMGSSSFNQEPFAYEEQVRVREPFELPVDSYVYSDVQYILSICGDDRSCRRQEMRFVIKSLRELKKEGYLEGRDFSKAVRDLKKALR
jgi:hypothetical protein